MFRHACLIVAGIILVFSAPDAFSGTALDPTLELLVQKGIISREEAEKAMAESALLHTNEMPAIDSSKWIINKALKNIQIYGDVRTRYEYREAQVPDEGKIELNRWRLAARIGLRGEAFDNYYYGFRLETSSNPRSSWITLGGSSPGPFGKSNTGIAIGQAYLGGHWGDWLDISVGKMANPFFTTQMVWDPDLNPEGFAERLHYNIGQANFFLNLGQFLYQDKNPAEATAGLVSGLPQHEETIFMLGWQGGVNYEFTKDISARLGATLYQYLGVVKTNPATSTDFTFVGEGGFLGPGTGTINGTAGPNNQTGINHLTVLEVPFQLDFLIHPWKNYPLSLRLFGDVAYNLDGKERAQEAAAAYANYLSINNATIAPFAPQTSDVKAYQFGVSIGSSNAIGLVTEQLSRKHAWEARVYWQHIEQYALDPNLLDSDFFEGRGNLEGLFVGAGYGISDNLFATFHYGYANRINDKIGTGGSNLDIPQVNPITHYHIFQVDLGFRF